MAMIMFDGFETYGTSASNLTRGHWTTVDAPGGVSTTGGRFGGAYLNVDTGDYCYLTFPQTSSEVWIGFAYHGNSNTGSSGVFYFTEGGTTAWQLGFHYDGTDESWFITRGTTPTILSGTSGSAPNDEWVYVEVRYLIDNSAGEVDLYINGVLNASVSSIDTQDQTNAWIDGGRLDSHAGNNCGFDDFYILDTSGSVLNTRLDQPAVRAYVPSADTAQRDLTPSTGVDNYALVDEIPPSDTDYVASGTYTDADEYEIENLSNYFESLDCVKVIIGAYKDDATSRGVTGTIESNGSYSTGTELVLAGTTDYQFDYIELDPNTSSAWSITGFNGSKLRAEVTT